MSLVHHICIFRSTLTHDLTINVRYIFWHISRSTVLCEKLTSEEKCISRCVLPTVVQEMAESQSSSSNMIERIFSSGIFIGIPVLTV